MEENKPDSSEAYENTERMQSFRERKLREQKRRSRNHKLMIGLLFAVIVSAMIAAAVGLAHLAAPQLLPDSVERLLWPTQTTEETEEETTAATTEETTEATTEETTQESTTKAPDPREDVWNHYSNIFIASKVDAYLNVRDQPTQDGMIVGKLTKYSGGELLEDLGNGWWHIKSGDIDGYISSDYCVTGEEARQLALEHCIEMVEVTTERLNVRSGPGTEYEVWTTINASERQVVKGKEGDWLQIAFNSTYGYINSDYVTTGFFLNEAVPWSSISGVSEARQQLLTYAEQFIGTPYVWGGNSLTEGVDCSGYTKQCFQNVLGITLYRQSFQQATQGTEIPFSQAKPGDLLFYADATGTINHVVFYLGDGKILHAAQSLGQVTISKYNYSTEPVKAVNIIGD